MIIWTGRGFFVFLFVIICSAVANFFTNSYTGSDVYWKDHKWPFAVSLLFAAVTCWYFGQNSLKTNVRVLIDPQTSKEVVLRNSHTLFFIPVIWWAPILAVLSVILLAIDLGKR